jgi:hypothetical protein
LRMIYLKNLERVIFYMILTKRRDFISLIGGMRYD